MRSYRPSSEDDALKGVATQRETRESKITVDRSLPKPRSANGRDAGRNQDQSQVSSTRRQAGASRTGAQSLMHFGFSHRKSTGTFLGGVAEARSCRLQYHRQEVLRAALRPPLLWGRQA